MRRTALAFAVAAVACAKPGFHDDDAGPEDAALEASPDGDSGATVYRDLTAATNWTFFDTTAIDPNASGYFGSAFDGRYVYLTPLEDTQGVAIELDTQNDFTTAKSWSAFDLGNDAGGANKFVGAIFDGRYLYYPPFAQSAPIVARYDTQGVYASGASWSTLDVSTVVAGAPGTMVGGVLAAKHVYFAPYGTPTMIAYDTTAPFGAATSWSSFDATSLLGSPFDACSAGTDGKYVYYAPFAGSAGASGLVLRYDTTALFTSSSAWTTFDASSVDARAVAFEGTVFDGRYLYFVPSGASFTSGFALRYDTQGEFAQGSSWSTFDIAALDSKAGGFVGGAFDGRYIYYVPYGGTQGTSGIVARYDTSGSFSDASAWQTLDLTTLNPGATGFSTATFDGRYLYLAPNLASGSPGHLVARFDAKSPAATPSGFEGSFF